MTRFLPSSKCLSVAVLAASILTSFHAGAQQVMLSTGTVILDDRTRAGEVLVGNPTQSLSSFEIQDAFFVQNDAGNLTQVSPEGPANSAQPHLRVGPRAFALGPGESQTVRIAARLPDDLPPGEYRMHLSVTNLSQSDAVPSDEGALAEGQQMGAVIRFNVARGVRLLVRHGVTPEGGRIEGVTAHQDGADTVLGFDLVRLGQTSFIGNWQVFARGADGREVRAWPSQGASLYPEVASRHFETRIPSAEVPADATLCIRLVVDDVGAPGLAPVEACRG
jgi:fimbrial chaperone protein